MSYNSTKTVAILLATYNGEKYITEQLDSIAHQTYHDYCCYIHDDGSTDGTRELVLNYCKRNPEQFRYVEGPSCGGAKYNFFFLMENIQNEKYIMFSDQDDYWMPEKVEVTLRTMQEEENNGQNSTEYICVYSNLEVVNTYLSMINTSFYKYSGKQPLKNDLKSLIMTNVVVGCTMMINRKLLEKALELKNRELLFMHDWWIALIASASGKMIFIDKPLIKYRQHSGNVVGANKKNGLLKRVRSFLSVNNYVANKKRMKRSINFSKSLIAIGIKPEKDDFLQDMSLSDGWNWFKRSRFFLRTGLIPLGKIWKIIWL